MFRSSGWGATDIRPPVTIRHILIFFGFKWIAASRVNVGWPSFGLLIALLMVCIKDFYAQGHVKNRRNHPERLAYPPSNNECIQCRPGVSWPACSTGESRQTLVG